MQIISHTDPDFRPRLDALRATLRAGGLTGGGGGPLDVPAIVRGIIADIRERGDTAVVEQVNRLDRARLAGPADLRVPAEVLAAAHRRTDPSLLALLRRAAANIRAYQEHIRHREPPPLVRDGVAVGVRYLPVRRAAVYVPGGRALYPSTVLMTAIPALVAGVDEVVMASPPTGGEICDLALALAYELGIREVYRMGGAVAVAALAYGTASIRPVDKIVGPGNSFVAEAKRQVSGTVGIDAIAGPSEVVIVADDAADPEHVAADLIAQAEHDPGSAVLITPSETLATAVSAAVDRRLATLERGAAARACLDRWGAIAVTADLDQACALADAFAPEHLEIQTHDDLACLARIRSAGAVFIGRHTPVSVGDYWAGPSHVLPTGGTARFSGPLSVNDFLVASSTIAFSRDALARDAADIEAFATAEGLTAHAAAVTARRGV